MNDVLLSRLAIRQVSDQFLHALHEIVDLICDLRATIFTAMGEACNEILENALNGHGRPAEILSRHAALQCTTRVAIPADQRRLPPSQGQYARELRQVVHE